VLPPLTPDMPPRILPRKRFGEDPSRPATPVALPACAAVAARAADVKGPLAVAPEPLVIAPERCNRCGACLRLGCGAISDVGEEALVIDAGMCVGGGLCAAACRARAIVRPAP
jgi:TPP-dependent indolepyruvate ferredoxin oxidoreductase alpha subunit